MNAILFKGDKIIVPKRTMTKKLYPGCYDYSGGGHVNYGESYLEAIVREIKEELGIDIFDIEEVAYLNPYVDDVGCFSRFFIAKYDKNLSMFNPDYVVAFKKYVNQLTS